MTEKPKKPKKLIYTWREAIWESNLSASTKLVLAVLSSHINDFGVGCYPSLDRIAEMSSLSERSVRQQIDKAIEAGWLIKTKKKLKGSLWNSNNYVQTFPPGFDLKRQVEFEGNVIPLNTSNSICLPSNEGNTVPPTPSPEGNDVPPRGELGSEDEGNDVPTNSPVLTPQRIDSVIANAITAADAAKPPAVQKLDIDQGTDAGSVPRKQTAADEPIDVKKQLWAAGKQYLIDNGVNKDRAGQMIGSWRKELGKALGEAIGDATLITILAQSQAEVAADPVGFIQGCIASNLTKVGKKSRFTNDTPVGDDGKPRSKLEMAQIFAARIKSAGHDAPRDRLFLSTLKDVDGTIPRDLLDMKIECERFLRIKPYEAVA